MKNNIDALLVYIENASNRNEALIEQYMKKNVLLDASAIETNNEYLSTIASALSEIVSITEESRSFRQVLNEVKMAYHLEISNEYPAEAMLKCATEIYLSERGYR